MKSITLRVARTEDAPALADIYRYYVEQTAISFEYEAPDAAEMERRRVTISALYPYLVAESGGRILGYAYAHPFIARAAYDWSVELTIYLAPGERHHGLGRALYAKVEVILAAMDVTNANACIGVPREADDPYLTDNSLAFHEHIGYRRVGTFTCSGYKFGRWYDMSWVEKILAPHTVPAAPIKSFADVRAEFDL